MPPLVLSPLKLIYLTDKMMSFLASSFKSAVARRPANSVSGFVCVRIMEMSSAFIVQGESPPDPALLSISRPVTARLPLPKSICPVKSIRPPIAVSVRFLLLASPAEGEVSDIFLPDRVITLTCVKTMRPLAVIVRSLFVPVIAMLLNTAMRGAANVSPPLLY